MEAIISFLIPVLIQVESGGCADPNNAIGDGGKAVGCLQIRKGVIDDVNERLKMQFKLEDRRMADKSQWICRLYLTYWGTRYARTTGKEPTAEVLARIWNSGPNGWKKESTLDYWRKVQKQLSVNSNQ